MCYTLYVSTTSPEDLSLLPNDFYRFETPDGELDSDPITVLRYPYKWYLACKYGGCSCHFRHESAENTSQVGPSQGFGPPEDWRPEDAEDVEATGMVYDLFVRLIEQGYRLDVLDIWDGADVTAVKSIDVSLADVPRESFRFFENYRFEVIP